MIHKPFVTATSHLETKQMASIVFQGIFLILCNYSPSCTNFYSASLILLITHSGFTFLLHILLFNSMNITFCIHLPCSIYYYTTLFLVCVCVWWTILHLFFSIILMFFIRRFTIFFKILLALFIICHQWTLI